MPTKTPIEERAAARSKRLALVLAFVLTIAALAFVAWFASQGATPA